jgi:elongation factor P
MQFLYRDAEGYHFMNQADYDQVALSGETLGSAKDFLIENLVIKVMYFNERPIGNW